MPVVRVSEVVRVVRTNEEQETNTVFNALSSQWWKPNSDERISYNPDTGSGYMDILLDRRMRLVKRHMRSLWSQQKSIIRVEREISLP